MEGTRKLCKSRRELTKVENLMPRYIVKGKGKQRIIGPKQIENGSKAGFWTKVENDKQSR